MSDQLGGTPDKPMFVKVVDDSWFGWVLFALGVVLSIAGYQWYKTRYPTPISPFGANASPDQTVALVLCDEAIGGAESAIRMFRQSDTPETLHVGILHPEGSVAESLLDRIRALAPEIVVNVRIASCPADEFSLQTATRQLVGRMDMFVASVGVAIDLAKGWDRILRTSLGGTPGLISTDYTAEWSSDAHAAAGDSKMFPVAEVSLKGPRLLSANYAMRFDLPLPVIAATPLCCLGHAATMCEAAEACAGRGLPTALSFSRAAFDVAGARFVSPGGPAIAQEGGFGGAISRAACVIPEDKRPTNGETYDTMLAASTHGAAKTAPRLERSIKGASD